ncbi:MAG: DNA polymerase III subunit gamma/tau [Parvibaculales bacterium]
MAEKKVAPKKVKKMEKAEYQVFARKYRPQSFADLLGQEVMVQTLSNAFASGRIAHAFMFTGMRGIGKTTTARILARALNYKNGEADEPSIDMPVLGVHCQEIMEGRHPDVIEMDAASRTGIDDIREIIESVRYKPLSARYKIYIIDEVHMLSKQAFNGLLKTLEEPPPHVKFIFATTEERKIPVTVLSRCQRFGLRRLDQKTSLVLLSKICSAEGVEMSEEAKMLIARAAEGSARDALSLLDRVIAHGTLADDTEKLRAMLGMADRSRIIDLLEVIMAGKLSEALEECAAQYQMGADPLAILCDLAELVHWVTRIKFIKKAGNDITVDEASRERGKKLASQLDVPTLARSWQILIKGYGEAQYAYNPFAAMEMVIIRMAHLSNAPSPDELRRKLESAGASAVGAPAPVPSGGGARAIAPQTQAVPKASPDKKLEITSFQQVIALAERERNIELSHALKHEVHLVKFAPPMIELRLAEGANNIAHLLSRSLLNWTGRQWMVSLSKEKGALSVHEQESQSEENVLEEVRKIPLIETALSCFPDAKIVNITPLLPVEDERDGEE